MTASRRTPHLLAATGLVTLATGASLLGLTAVVLPGPWVGAGLVGIVLVAAAAAGTRAAIGARRAGRSGAADDGGVGSVLPTLAAALVGAWYLLARYGAPGEGPRWVPGPDAVGRVVDRLGQAGEIMRGEVAPVVGSAPIAMLCVGGAVVVLLVADALASGLRHPLLGGVPVLVLWFPPLVLVGRVPWGVFVVTVAALLLTLALDGAPAPGRRSTSSAAASAVRRAGRRRTASTTATAAVVAVAALLAGTGAGVLPGGSGSWTDAFTTTARTVRLSEDLDMYRSLTARSDEVVLRYTSSTGDDVGPLRIMTLSAFDGRDWGRGPQREGDPFGPDDVLAPTDAPLTGDRVELDVTVGTLREDQLPVSIEPRDVVSPADGWRYDPARDELVGGPRTQQGDRYEIGVRPRVLTPERLRGAPAADDVDDAFLAVPESAHAADVAATAAEVAGAEPTRYDQAVALQTFLRDTTRFTYDTEVPRGRTGDAVWDFLQQRTGYCVQFATTMVVMARALGIPARLAVGFLPGRTDDDGVWEVTGQDSHAWPELWFEDTGWVRFEPTPAVQTGAAPRYADPSLATGTPPQQPSLEQERPRGPAASAAAPLPTLSPSTAPSPGVTAERGTPWGAWAGAVGVLLAAAGAVWLWLRRREGADRRLDPERAWDRVLVALARQGVTLPPATTPRAAPEAVAAGLESRTGRTLGSEAQAALHRLARAVEDSRYARRAPDLAPEELEALVATVTAAVAGTERPARERAAAGAG
ncbi:DUF3488 and transglutaminase-like domain-containing protein [Puerhibacterium puerhi]|uniref:DUF3488 and transglutaminase-like domain-containing protein n=1 Tax=Puerhibacterium puerhi TaxID=2692623 RepID=UPI001357B81B|nr:transglutaminaseTgpA domain-containing protein [Puerhibacterium puerhi]